jgi:hypothetical protein
MRRAIRYVALITATVVAAIVFSQLPVLGQEGRGGRGGEGRQGGQAQSLPEAPPIGFFGSYRIAADKIDPSKLPIIGAWRINFDRSDPALKLANRFKDTGTVIYSAENGGIKQEVFLYWPPTKVDYKNVFTDDAREFFFKLDGKNIYPNSNPITSNGNSIKISADSIIGTPKFTLPRSGTGRISPLGRRRFKFSISTGTNSTSGRSLAR